MLQVQNLNKFYNRGKDNEIHVINDISITFPNTGLVAIVGPSGSGKTTLLNAIGGLDRINEGDICYDENICDSLMHGKYDRPVGLIVTEKRIIDLL